jgi:hypothetical protein
MPYMWSTIDSWAEEISKVLLRVGFVICMVIGGHNFSQLLVTLEDKVVLRFW